MNVEDLLQLLSQFGRTDSEADLNADGVTNVEDLLLLLAAFGRTCDQTQEPAQVTLSGLNNGVACQDEHTGTGYILYSAENVHTRFAAASPHADNAENFICAVFDASSSQWSYDNNGNHVVFTPRDTDLLVAAVDFTNDLITSGAGVSGTVGGCLLYTSPSPRDGLLSRMPSSA